MASTIEFTTEVQELFLRIMVTEASLYTRIISIMNPANFDRRLRPVAEFIIEHASKYNVLPDPVQISAVTGVEIARIDELTDGHYDWFITEFENFTKRQELERAILKSAELLDKGDYGPVEKLIKDAVQISLQKDMGTDYFADPKGRIEKYYNQGGQVSTGWPQLDRILFGGFSRGELSIFCGGSGCVTEDTLVEIIELPNLNLFAKGDSKKIKKLFNKTQPKKVPIGNLFGKIDSKKTYMVTSPDGYVPVLDCIKKIKSDMYTVQFNNGSIINASHDHLFQKSDQTWHYTKDLLIGDCILSDIGEVKITEINNYDKKTEVYDLSVGHVNHRYYTNGICSHNSGKSLVMMNIALNWLAMGMSGVYISLELSEELTSLRTDAMLTAMSTREIRKDVDSAELKVKIASKKYGEYRVKYLPAQSNVNTIRAYIKEVQLQTGIKVDFVMIDYLDLVMPSGAKVSAENQFIKDKYVSEELRNLSQELGILCITASQLNRGAVDEIEFDHSDIAGGISKIYSADNVFGIFTSRSMRERGKYQIQCMKSRSSTGLGHKIDLEYNVETMRITDEDQDNSIDKRVQQSPSDIMNRIKTTSTLNSSMPAPVTGNASVIASNSQQGNKLKSLLADIKTK